MCFNPPSVSDAGAGLAGGTEPFWQQHLGRAAIGFAAADFAQHAGRGWQQLLAAAACALQQPQHFAPAVAAAAELQPTIVPGRALLTIMKGASKLQIQRLPTSGRMPLSKNEMGTGSVR